MSQPLSEYFAQEAGEYLDRLDALLSRPEAPDPVEFFRLARGVRWSAQLAGAHGVARGAEGVGEARRGPRPGGGGGGGGGGKPPPGRSATEPFPGATTSAAWRGRRPPT